MDLLETQSKPDRRYDVPRARRIRDEEWGIWRDLLTRLYVEDDVSRKDLVGIMANEHQFIVNEKQLKHRFKKWDVKKYIPDSDIAAMLSFQKKRRAARDQVTFEFRGHKVEEERLERAAKRRKRSPPPDTVLPPYIKAYISPHQNEMDVSPSEPNPLDHEGRFTIQSQRQPSSSANHDYHQRVSPTDIKDNIEPIEVIEEVDRGGLIQGIQAQDDMTTMDPSDPAVAWPSLTSDLQLIESEEVCSFECTDYGRSVTPPWSSWPYNLDWSTFLDLPCSRQTSIDTNTVDVFSSQNAETQCQPASSRPSLTPRIRIFDIQPNVQDSLPTVAFSTTSDVDRTVHEHVDVSGVITPLHQLHSYLFPSSGDTGLDSSKLEGWDLAAHEKILRSSWLRHELEDVLCQVYEDAAKDIRQRQRIRNNLPNSEHEQGASAGTLKLGTQDKSASIVQASQQGVNDGRRSRRSRTKLTSDANINTPSGIIRTQLRTLLKRASPGQDEETPSVLCLSFMPAAWMCTTGISAIFTRSMKVALEPKISPEIKTFNVIPQDSEIIQCVSNNDLSGVQRLFANGKASALDVDPEGFSLLSYAIDGGCSEVFLMLLRGGASTQNCSHYSHSLDIVWICWFRYVDHISHLLTHGSQKQNQAFSSSPRRAIEDFDQCRLMTNAALGQGHDIEDAVAYQRHRANPLFEVNELWSLGPAHSAAPETVLDYLINIGYDLEKPNHFGLTPLLHAAQSYRPQVIKCLNTFIKRGAKLDAVNCYNQGALHLALEGPHSLYEWQHFRNRDFPSGGTFKYLWPLKVIYHTEDNTAETPSGEISPSEIEGNNVRGIAHLPMVWTSESSWQPESFVDLQTSSYGKKIDINTAKDTVEGNHLAQDEDRTIDYVICQDYNGVEHLIRHPVQVLKARLRSILLTLLRHGCDPNVIDDEKATPSDYARKYKLWPQWSCALERTGYTYDMRNDCWVKLAEPDSNQTAG